MAHTSLGNGHIGYLKYPFDIFFLAYSIDHYYTNLFKERLSTLCEPVL